MNDRTGEIREFVRDEPMEADFVSIERDMMTSLQEETKQVSKFDNRSVLGRKFKDARAKRRWQMRQIKNQSKS